MVVEHNVGAPETGESTALTGRWTTVQPGLPPVFADIADSINTFASTLVALLNVALAILNVVKAFMIGFLDPLVPIIEAIIETIESQLQALRQLGIYMAGDAKLIYPFDGILGGYAAYERRMIKRLTDRNDPTRPNFTSHSGVVAIFLYVSADASRIHEVCRLLKRIRTFFGDDTEDKMLSVPVGLRARYGMDGAGLYTFGALGEACRAGTVPDSVNLTWQMAVPPSTGLVQWPLPAPAGFLIEVSVYKDGFLVVAEVPAPRDAGVVQTRIQGLVTYPSGKVMSLYGGQDRLDLGDLLGNTSFVSGGSFNAASPSFDSSGDLKPGAGRVLLYRSNADTNPIPVDALKAEDAAGNDIYVFQRTFYVSTTGTGATLSGPGQPFSITLKHSDMPWDAEVVDEGNGDYTVNLVGDAPAPNVYVRISAVTEEVVEYAAAHGGDILETCRWELSSITLESMPNLHQWAAQNSAGRPLYAVGDPSTPLDVTFPSADTQDYLDTLTAALAIMILARADLRATNDDSTFQADVGYISTGLEGVADFLIPWLLGPNPSRFFRKNLGPVETRQTILDRCRVVANDLYSRMGPSPSLETYIKEQGEYLRTFKWSDLGGDWAFMDMTILESLEDTSSDSGIALGPSNVGLTEVTTMALQRKGTISPTRAPGFLEMPNANPNMFIMGQGSGDHSPVLFDRNLWEASPRFWFPVEFIRNVLFQDGNLTNAAQAVLGVAATPLVITRDSAAGSWRSVRMFPGSLPALDMFMEDILRWVKAIQVGVSAVTEMIKAYIEFLEARILEIQAAIVRINALLQSLLQFTLPAASGLVLLSEGTDGVLQEFISAQDKPSDSTTAYGAGMVILAGGVPMGILEILQFFFPTVED